MEVIPIVALDFPSEREARALIEKLGDACSFYKVGSELFTAAGPGLVESTVKSGNRVFLDLKFHDIPNTVAGAVRGAAKMGVSLLTVHISGGSAMLRAAVAAAAEGDRSCKIFGVTVLTSLDRESFATVSGRPSVQVADEVDRLAMIARSAGLHGIVCSGHEAASMRAKHGSDLELLIPGIRLSGDGAGDQVRTVSPAEAARAGAHYIVLGRAVTRASDPRLAMLRVAAELAGMETPSC